MTKSAKKAIKKLRVVMLADTKLLPVGHLEDFSEKQRELHKTEFDVLEAIKELGHEVFPVGVSDDLTTIRGAIDALKPHVAFNLVEEFAGVAHFDQHVVSYLELRSQPHTGCNPRGMTLSRDKAITKKILAYHGIKVPEFAIFPQRHAFKRPGEKEHHRLTHPGRSENLGFPVLVKSLTAHGSAGISGASIVHDMDKLRERVEFIHRTTKSTAIAEQFIEGREIYVGVMGNDRAVALPAWELTMTKADAAKPMIATSRAKWDAEYQRQIGLKTGAARLSEQMQKDLANLSKEIYRLLGMSGYARLDYRLTDAGDAYLLEANPNPQIAKDEDFSQSARHAGLSYPELIQQLMHFGMTYKPTRMIY